MLVMSIGTTFAQQKKVTIGNYSLYDSSGTLVLSKTSGESKFKVNGSGWVRPRDLDSTVAGSGLSLNTVLGLRFNAGSGVEVDANDTVITTGVTSYAVVDSILMGGTLITSIGANKIAYDSLSLEALYTNFIFFGRYSEPAIYEGKIFTDIGANLFIYGGDGSDVKIGADEGTYYLTIGNSGISTAVFPTLNFTIGDTVKIGTTDNYDLRFKRNSEVYLTLGSANLIVEGNTPLKFMDSNVFVSGFSQTGTLGNAPTIGDPTKYLIVYDNNGVDFAIPMWDIP